MQHHLFHGQLQIHFWLIQCTRHFISSEHGMLGIGYTNKIRQWLPGFQQALWLEPRIDKGERLAGVKNPPRRSGIISKGTKQDWPAPSILVTPTSAVNARMYSLAVPASRVAVCPGGGRTRNESVALNILAVNWINWYHPCQVSPKQANSWRALDVVTEVPDWYLRSPCTIFSRCPLSVCKMNTIPPIGPASKRWVILVKIELASGTISLSSLTLKWAYISDKRRA